MERFLEQPHCFRYYLLDSFSGDQLDQEDKWIRARENAEGKTSQREHKTYNH